MLPAHEEWIDLCATHQLTGIDCVNELLRFNVLDQLIRGNAQAREWGVSLEDLYQLAQKSTTESFGEVPYDMDTFQALYGPSFAVDPMAFISDTGLLDGIDEGLQWNCIIEEHVAAHKDSDELVLYAYVEEYAGMIEHILQSYDPKKVVLYTASPNLYSVLTRLYPLANIVDMWPSYTYFEHIFALSVGMFQGTDTVGEEVANGMNQLLPEGTAQLFLPASMVQNQTGLNKLVMNYFLQVERVESMYEWAPLGVYEINIGVQPVDKMNIGVKEVDGDEVHTIPFIKLPHGVFGEMPVFTVVNYALSLRSILLPGEPLHPALSMDGMYCLDTRIPKQMKDMLRSQGCYYLVFHSSDEYVQVEVTTAEPTHGVYWMFPDQELPLMWYAYFSSSAGQTIALHIRQLVKTEEAFGYLLGSCRRNVLNVQTEMNVTRAIQEGKETFEAALEAARNQWVTIMDRVGCEVMPAVDSIHIDISVGMDEEK